MCNISACCSFRCEKYSTCKRAFISGYTEDYYSFGSGSISDAGIKEEYWCGPKGNYKMYIPINTPELGKSEPHGFDNRPLTMLDFFKLKEAAQIVSNTWGYPVYLVGSVLYKEVPRDIDISVIIPVEAYEDLFGKIPNNQDDFPKYLNDVLYNSFKYIEPLMTCLSDKYHVDVKVCPNTWWKDKPKFILATPDI